ncbi:MAG: YidC/Oxa1 family membrane protein insertase [Tissierellia bacterium]|nr:YidC/Oxa1 family membrane protein insertase [Tissierellia bacterium]
MSTLYEILGRIFRFIYDTLVGLGPEPSSVSYYAMALLVMAVIYKLLTIPLTIQQAKATKKTAELQPKIEELKKKYGYNQEILNQKIQEFQKENNATQAGCSSCLMIIVQFVIVIALFGVIREPAKYLFDNPEQINTIARNFFWIPDLSLADPTGWLLALLNSGTQMLVSFLSQQNTPGVSEQAQSSQKMMLYILPVVFFFMFRTMPAGLVLYWTAGNVIEIVVKLITKGITSRQLKTNEVQ